MAGQLIADVISANGSRRDLLDYITNVDAKDCPLTSMLPKGPGPDNRLLEWPLDNEETPDPDNATEDGKDVEAFDNAVENYGVGQNYIQWFRHEAMVGKLAQNVQNQAGIKDKKAYAVRKKLTQLKRSIETAIASDNEAQNAAAGVPYKTRGMGKYIQNGAQTVLPIPSAYRTPTASVDSTAIASVTDTTVQNVLTSMWGETGSSGNHVLVCGSTLKRAFTDLTRVASGTNEYYSVRNFNQDGAGKKIVDCIDAYHGDFGKVELVPTHWNNWSSGSADARRGYVIDPEKWQLRFNQQAQVMELPDQGGGPRFAVDAILGLVCLSPLGQGAFKATS